MELSCQKVTQKLLKQYEKVQLQLSKDNVLKGS